MSLRDWLYVFVMCNWMALIAAVALIPTIFFE